MASVPPVDLEVCIDSLESAAEAVQKGASSVEVCFRTHEGGYSPSIGLLKVIKDNLNLPVFMVVRPYRPDYGCSDAEFQIMCDEVKLAQQVGVDGFVFGILAPSTNQLDINRCHSLISLCHPLPCTLSHAFDQLGNPVMGLEDAVKCGFKRVLVNTERYSNSGTQLALTLQEQAKGRIAIVPARNTPSLTMDQLSEENTRLQVELSRKKSEEEERESNPFSLGSILSHPSVVQRLAGLDIRHLLTEAIRAEGEQQAQRASPLEQTSSPASPQMASLNRLRNISPNAGVNSPDNNGLEYVSAFNPLKPTIMVSGMASETARVEPAKPIIQRRDSLQVPDLGECGGLSRRRSLDGPNSNAVQQMEATEPPKDLTMLKKERSLSAPEALFYPSLMDQVLAFKQSNVPPDPRLFSGSSSGGGGGPMASMRSMLRMNVRRGPLQKKLDALKASSHIDEEFKAVISDNSCESEGSTTLNNSLKEMDICDYSMSYKRKRWYGPNQKKIDDSNLMHALKSGLEYSRTLKQESDFNVFKKEVELLYDGSECINERTILCGKCGKTYNLSWLRYHQQFKTEHWAKCTTEGAT